MMHPDCATPNQLKNLIPESKEGWRAERIVYDFFRKYMPREWSVFYDVHLDATVHWEQHQMDFLVLIPGMGVVNVDAKGAGYYLENGTIRLRDCSRNKGKQGFWKDEGKPVNIYEKASRSIISFNNYVTHTISNGEAWGAYSYLVLFDGPIVAPSTERTAAFSLEGAKANPQRVARELEACLRGRLERFSNVFDEFPKYEAKLISCLGKDEQPAEINTQFQDWDAISESMLTRPQMLVFQQLRKNNFCHVQGAAGTGKTLIAIAAAKKYAKEGLSVLYVCFNVALAEKLKRQLGRFDAIKRLSITSFDQIQSVFGRAPEWKNFPKDNRAPWDEYLEKVVPLYASRQGRFDVLIVDETQDLSQRELLILFSCLNEERKIALFSDAEQTIFSYGEAGWDYDEKALFQNQPVAQLILDMNYRNTAAIHNAVMRRYETNADITAYWTEDMLGQEPVPVQSIAESAVKRKLSEVLGHASMSQVAFLSFLKERLVPYSDMRDSQNHHIHFVKEVEKWERGEGILKATVQSFKGLEADVVFLFALNDSKWADDLKYVGLSRAKYELYIVE